MLSKEKILANQAKFQELNEKYSIMSSALLDVLGDKFYEAPASTMLSLHNAFPGGLLDHLMKVARYAVQLNRLIPQTMRQDERSVFKVAFISEIGKTNLYIFNESEWHRKNQGKMYEFNEDLTSMRVGERSAYLALSNGVELTPEEFQAIVNHDKPCDDMQAKWHSSTLAQILRQAIDLAIMEEKHLEEVNAVAEAK